MQGTSIFFKPFKMRVLPRGRGEQPWWLWVSSGPQPKDLMAPEERNGSGSF